MRLATFNVENLFSRPWALNHSDYSVGQPVIDDMNRLNALLKEPLYTPIVRTEIEQLAERHRLFDRFFDDRRLVLREVRGTLWTQHADGSRTWQAQGADDYLAWVELATVALDDRSIDNTARVIAAVDADIQVVVEVENRIALQRFHDDVLLALDTVDGAPAQARPYEHVLLMDGNDPRGIDVGLLARVRVSGMRSHIELRGSSGKPLFPRDCAMFVFELAGDERLVVFANHFSSQASDKTGQRRQAQSGKVAELVDAALQWTPYVVVCGDLNEGPSAGHMPALLAHPQLRDAMAMPQYDGAFPGTYKTAGRAGGSDATKLDYLLLSTALQGRVQAVGVERRGYVSTKWKPFVEIEQALVSRPQDKERIQASDHHCLWVDLDL
jgi:endonuclease/exonuclease/phosphatase family metal-dependent hydrolase